MSARAEAEAEARRNWAPRPDLDEGLNGKHSSEVSPDNGDGIHTDAGHRPEADPEADAALTIDGDAWEPAEVPLRPWVAKGYLLRGAVTLVAGPPSALKSSLMLSWASSIALNKRFGEFRPVEAGVAIVYNVEDDQDEQKRRLEATLRQFSASPNDIAGKVFRVSPRSIGTLLTHGLDGKPQFTPAMRRLERLVAEHRPAVFIADPFSELHTEEENDNTSVRAVVAMFREFAVKHNMAVVILHHTRKGASHAAGDPDIARGASSIVGAVRIEPHRVCRRLQLLRGWSHGEAEEVGTVFA